jgi:hypothetical protein
VQPPARRTERQRDAVVLAGLASATLLVHFLCNNRYGYWIDELYFIACGEHLAWGYVDHPPLIAAVAAGSRWLLGDSLFAIRFLPALAGAALVFLAGWMARALGGRRFAQVTAALCAMVAPVYLAFGNLLTMNAFEPLLWTACAYIVVEIVERDQRRLWLLVGLVVGVGVLNKHSMAFFAAALGAGLLLTPERRVLWTGWLAAALALAFLVVLPHLVWQMHHGWPSLELMRNATLYQYQPVSPAEFLWGQIQLVHPFTVPIWIAGLCFYLWTAQGRPFRFLGWAFVLLFGAALLVEAKSYYLAPAYSMLLAAGGVMAERGTQRPGWRWLRPATIVLLLLGGVISAPYVLPVLPVEMMPRYLELLGIKAVRPERRAEGDVPQLFADMLGWEDTVATVARVYASLSPAEQAECAIWSASYGAAGAVDFLGRAYGLPPAISGHQNYYLWGPGRYAGNVAITIGIPIERLRPWFASVERVASVRCPYCMPDRQDTPICVARGLKVPIEDFWPQVKCWTCDAPAFAKQTAPPAQPPDSKVRLTNPPS